MEHASFRIKAYRSDADSLQRILSIPKEKADRLVAVYQEKGPFADAASWTSDTDLQQRMEKSLLFKFDLNRSDGSDLGLLPFLAPSHLLLFLVISFEYLGVGLGTAAFVAFTANVTDKRYTATQFALLSSLGGLPRTAATAATGFMVQALGYTTFFLVCTIAALPGMILLVWAAPWNASRESDPQEREVEPRDAENDA